MQTQKIILARIGGEIPVVHDLNLVSDLMTRRTCGCRIRVNDHLTGFSSELDDGLIHDACAIVRCFFILLHFHNCPYGRASCRRLLVCFAIPAPANYQQDCSKYHQERTHDQPRKWVAETPSPSTSKSKTRSSSAHEILLVGKDWINIIQC